jgi:hypothetical protein
LSIANIVVARDKALIGFDTKSAFMATPVSGGFAAALKLAEGGAHTSKCMFLPHANVAMPTLGDNLLATVVFERLQLRPDLIDLDGMVQAMPEILATAYDGVMAQRQALGITQFPGSAIFLVGWSNALGRMECVRWTRWPDDSAFKAEQVRHESINPDTGRKYDVPITDAEMEKIAREQVAYARGLPNAEYDCGGRLLVAELTRDTLNVRTVANLEE